MNIVFALLYMVLFVGLLAAVNKAVNKKEKNSTLTIYWLPLRPALIGLMAGLFLCVFAVFPVLLILQVQAILIDFLRAMVVTTIWGIIAYWVPTAWFVRKFNGQSLDIALI